MLRLFNFIITAHNKLILINDILIQENLLWLVILITSLF